MKKKILLTASLFTGTLAAAGIVYLYGLLPEKAETAQPARQKEAPLVGIITVAPARISEAVELTGSVEPYRVARLASPAEGPVEQIRVREADRVEKGETLASIGRTKGIDASIASLEEELKKEEDNLGRIRQLVEIDALPGEQLDQASAAYEKVRALLVNAEERALDYVITAPWAGVISSVNVTEGEFVAPRVVLLEMYDPATLVIRASVPETHAADVRAGMPVEVRLDAYPDARVQGRIQRIYPYLDPRLRTRTMEIVLDEPVRILPGMFARLEVLFKSEDNAVAVPLEALVDTPEGRAVFLFEDGKAVTRAVETGMEKGNRVQIVAGIRPGDRVIVSGNEKLKNGAEVRIAGGEQPGAAKNKGMAGNPAGLPGKTGGGQ